MRALPVFVFISLAFSLGNVACSSSGSDAADDCSASVNLACTPAYAPSFDNVFQITLKRSCALAGTSCHASAGAKAGLVMDDPDVAYRGLVDQERVVPGKPECSLVTRRIFSNDTSFMMPPGLPLAAGEQCAIIQWVAQGAKR